MWHVSIANPTLRGHQYTARFASIARQNLAGVGNPMREWRYVSDKAYHLRRRLTRAEQSLVGDAVDLRNTPEAIQRLEAIRDQLPEHVREFASQEICGEL